jgi:hypothetical protein
VNFPKHDGEIIYTPILPVKILIFTHQGAMFLAQNAARPDEESRPFLENQADNIERPSGHSLSLASK